MSKEQRAKCKEQRAKSKEQRAKNKEQRTMSKEQRAKNKEQRAKNKEQRTKSKDRVYSKLMLCKLLCQINLLVVFRFPFGSVINFQYFRFLFQG